MKRTALSTEEFIKRAILIHGYKYDYSLVKYKNSREKIKIICINHGIFEQTPSSHIFKGNGCKKCSKTFKLNTDEFILRAKKIHGDKYDYDMVEYIGIDNKIDIRCKIHGRFKQTPLSHLQSKHGCNKCFRESKTSNPEAFIQKALKKHNEKYDYSLTNYENNIKKIIIVCKKHGEFIISPAKHLNGQGCNLCLKDIIKEKFIKDANEIHKNKYTYNIENYVDSHTKIKIICSKHGEFEQQPTNHISKNGCPRCFGRISNAECDINTFLAQYVETIQNSRSIISPYELDIYIPSHNIAIEYCGLYWHSNKYKDKNYHLKKLTLCEKQGIRLITIFEDEWLYREDIVKNKLKTLLGVSALEKVHARKTNVIELSSREKVIFLEQNHIQGNGPGSLTYGLVYNDELIAVMTFINLKNFKFILNRYATSKRVIGGFSKLLNYFMKNNKWEQIISFADMRWSYGSLYEKCGFSLDKILKPDYQYVNMDHIIREHKFNYRHKNLHNKLKHYDKDLSESENCKINRILKIWDCGKRRYIKNEDNS